MTNLLGRLDHKKEKNYFTYRFVFLPETIGSIAYIKKNLNELRAKNAVCFVLTCIEDDLNFSLIPNKKHGSYSAKIARHVYSRFSQ